MPRFFFIAEDLPAYSGNRGGENMNSVMTYVGILLGLVVVCGLLGALGEVGVEALLQRHFGNGRADLL